MFGNNLFFSQRTIYSKQIILNAIRIFYLSFRNINNPDNIIVHWYFVLKIPNITMLISYLLNIR